MIAVTQNITRPQQLDLYNHHRYLKDAINRPHLDTISISQASIYVGKYIL